MSEKKKPTTSDDDDDAVGVPEWVVTYGDMMSLLLTFFIMLVSLSEVVNNRRYQDILDALQKYQGYRSGAPTQPGIKEPFNALQQQRETLGSYRDTKTGSGGVKIKSVDGPKNLVYRTREGHKSRKGKLLVFEPDSAELTREVHEQLQTIVPLIAGKKGKVHLKGHVAAQPLGPNSQFANKFELSYARSHAVYKKLAALGVSTDRLIISAAGDSEPQIKTGDKQSLLDDRVEVLESDVFVDEFAGTRKED
jgi:chemotaxis protein MotB